MRSKWLTLIWSENRDKNMLRLRWRRQIHHQKVDVLLYRFCNFLSYRWSERGKMWQRTANDPQMKIIERYKNDTVHVSPYWLLKKKKKKKKANVKKWKPYLLLYDRGHIFFFLNHSAAISGKMCHTSIKLTMASGNSVLSQLRPSNEGRVQSFSKKHY